MIRIAATFAFISLCTAGNVAIAGGCGAHPVVHIIDGLTVTYVNPEYFGVNHLILDHDQVLRISYYLTGSSCDAPEITTFTIDGVEVPTGFPYEVTSSGVYQLHIHIPGELVNSTWTWNVTVFPAPTEEEVVDAPELPASIEAQSIEDQNAWIHLSADRALLNWPFFGEGLLYISFTSMDGKTTQQQTYATTPGIQRHVIPVSGLSSGVYVIRLQQDEEIRWIKAYLP